MHLGVLVEQLLAPIPGGTGRFTRELIAALVSVPPPGTEVTGWCAWHASTGPAAIDDVVGPRCLPLGRRSLAVAWERGVGPAPRGADVVLAPTLLVPPRRGRPLVVTIQDAVPWTHPETLTARGVAFHRRMAARAAAEADAILFTTRAMADELADRLRLQSARVHVVGAGASSAVTVAPADAAERRTALGLPPAYFLTVSTLEPRKGLDVALDALALAPSLPLFVAGQPGWGGIDLAAAALDRGLGPGRIRALGNVGDADLAAVLAGATALVAPSRAEGFGLPVLEAMAAGVPVVSSDAPALAEVGGGATLTVPVGDAHSLAIAMARLSSDAALRADLVARGLDRAAAYSWGRTAAAVWAVVLDLAS